MNSSLSLQQQLFADIKSQMQKDQTFIDEICETLDISIDSAYRRVRGSKVLSLEEAIKLCARFDLSIDELMDGSKRRMSFSFQPISEGEFDFNQYLRYINQMMRLIREGENRKMMYLANDIPLYHLLSSPVIASFKLFFWRKTILEFSEFEHEKFQLFSPREKEVDTLSREIRKSYMEVPSIEIYSPETIDTTLKQIAYYFDSGLFASPDIAIVLCDELEKLVEHLRAQSKVGYKFKRQENNEVPSHVPYKTEGNYTVYYNEVLFTDATVLAEVDGRHMTYLTNNGLNVLSTKDERFYAEYLASFNRLLKKSTMISGSSERERNRFFNRYQSKIEHLRNKLELGIGDLGFR